MGIAAKFEQVKSYVRTLSIRRRLALLGLLFVVGLLLTGLGGSGSTEDALTTNGVPGEHEFDDINALLATFEGEDTAAELRNAGAPDDPVARDSVVATEGLTIPSHRDSLLDEPQIQSVSSSTDVSAGVGAGDQGPGNSGQRPIRLSGTIFPIH